eukprot:3360866-Pyramimonas_sp.AAC.1
MAHYPPWATDGGYPNAVIAACDAVLEDHAIAARYTIYAIAWSSKTASHVTITALGYPPSVAHGE